CGQRLRGPRRRRRSERGRRTHRRTVIPGAGPAFIGGPAPFARLRLLGRGTSTAGPGRPRSGQPPRLSRTVREAAPGPATERTHARHHRLAAVADRTGRGVDPRRRGRLVDPPRGLPVLSAERLL